MENSSLPFFSIVIPTKNRPQLLKDAIQSVLWQDFNDFELIVSDNFNDQSTQEVIDQFSDHIKFRSIRTDSELKMIDHWEFATKHVKGKYVLVLADRKVLYQGALKKLASVIKKNPSIKAFSFGVQTYNELTNQYGWNNPVGSNHLFRSEELIQNFLKVNYYTPESLDRCFPKTLNGCYLNEFASDVRERFGAYFNVQGVTTPDYSSFFINCALNEEVLYIGKKIILTQGETSSNGRIFGAGKFHAYMESLGLSDPYKHVEIKAPLIYNLLTVDLLTIKDQFRGNLQNTGLDIRNYYRTNYYELFLKTSQGLDEDGRKYFEQEWDKALKQNHPELNSAELKQAIISEFQSFNINNPKWDKIKRFNYHLKDYLSLRYSKGSIINKIFKFKYENIFHAAGFKL
jgi:glycosyltransferase involved in cell wall biosynthesis